MCAIPAQSMQIRVESRPTCLNTSGPPTLYPPQLMPNLKCCLKISCVCPVWGGGGGADSCFSTPKWDLKSPHQGLGGEHLPGPCRALASFPSTVQMKQPPQLWMLLFLSKSNPPHLLEHLHVPFWEGLRCVLTTHHGPHVVQSSL